MAPPTAGEPDYLTINRAMWDDRAPAHAASPGYAVQQFVDDATHLSKVVRFDLPRLGDISGLDGLHLQCHIGTDTLSLARLGARMTGLDLSPASLAQARSLAERLGLDVPFVESDVYSAVEALGEKRFDLIYTGIGALCWLPDIRRWAQVVATLLRPGGRLFLREGHPMLWTLDETQQDRLAIAYSYWEQAEPFVEVSDETYVPTEVQFTQNLSHSWNHALGEVVTALLDAGLRLTMLVEHDSVPWEALPGQMQLDDAGEYRLTDRPQRVAMSYTLQAVSPIGTAGSIGTAGGVLP
ncbi:MAG: class I SAM-dependent methyltransferase [Kineosporiaceae bacterium]